MFAKVLIALVVATSFVVATSVPQKRSDVATCDFVISPVTPLPSTANLVAEINFGMSFYLTRSFIELTASFFVVVNRNFAVAVTGSDVTVRARFSLGFYNIAMHTLTPACSRVPTRSLDLTPMAHSAFTPSLLQKARQVLSPPRSLALSRAKPSQDSPPTGFSRRPPALPKLRQ